MAALTYSMLLSLDGYVAGEDGSFDWAVPDDEVHQFINDLERPVGTCLYGRRMHEVMAAWETDPSVAGQSALAGQAMRAGLVDELHLFVAPVHVGGGTRAFPRDVRLDLDLQDQRRFGNGMVYLRYRTIG